jgi:hypothetical protein
MKQNQAQINSPVLPEKSAATVNLFDPSLPNPTVDATD